MNTIKLRGNGSLEGLEDFISEPAGDNPQFLEILAKGLRTMGMSVTAVLLVTFSIALLIGDIIFGVIAWGQVIPNMWIALILEAVPNVGIIALGMAIAWKSSHNSWGNIIKNASLGIWLFLVFAVVLGAVDAVKDAVGVYDMVIDKTNYLAYLAVAFVFVLSALGEVLALNLPEFFDRAVH